MWEEMILVRARSPAPLAVHRDSTRTHGVGSDSTSAGIIRNLEDEGMSVRAARSLCITAFNSVGD